MDRKDFLDKKDNERFSVIQSKSSLSDLRILWLVIDAWVANFMG